MPIKPTNENLEQFGHAPLMRYLIATALDASTMTYGQAKARLEAEHDFATIFSTKMGYVVGSMMDRILAVDEDAPLLNVLMVSQQTRLPSDGAAGYMADRFNIPGLREKGTRHRLWKDSFDEAAHEVFEYTADDWAELYEQVFGEPLSEDLINNERERRRTGAEEDGLHYGRRGEGPNHRALRLWVRDNPAALSPDYLDCRAETEVCLDSADRVDAVFYCDDRIVVIEVKSRDSNEADLRRGVYQCVKYRAVQRAMDVRQDGYVEPILVTEKPIPGEIRDLLRIHDIAHFQAAMDRT